MVQTLVEYAKTFEANDKRRAIIELFPKWSTSWAFFRS